MDRTELDIIRGFNRTVTLRSGAMEESYLGRGRPLGQARLLFEIGEDGGELKVLRERTRLVAAMSEVGRLLWLATLTIAVEPPASLDARACVAAYVRELGLRFEEGFDPGNGNPTPDDEALTPPAGCFLVARLDGRAVGCGALRRLAPGVGEIKRMWVAPEASGLGLSRRLLGALEDQARGRGLSRVRLDTNRSLSEAQSLYRSAGYREIARFNDNPYADFWFEKALNGG
jgi:ribosomal protein S18 acetylase RimI-like enzyme